MAEALLGAVTGGFAVASLAIQLVEVSQKLYDIWDSFEATDPNIDRIKDHLSLIQIISRNIIDICNQETRISCGDVVVRSLKGCQERAEQLERLVKLYSQSQDKSVPKRVWKTVKMTLKDKTIQRVESQLRGDAMMLLLTLQPFFHYVQCQKFSSLSGQVSQLSSPASLRKDKDVSKAQLLSPFPKPNSEFRLRSLYGNAVASYLELQQNRMAISTDLSILMERISAAIAVSMPSSWKRVLQSYPLGLMYTSVKFSRSRMSLLLGGPLCPNTKRRIKLALPLMAFEIQTSSIPCSLTLYPITSCKSEIFKLCANGDINTVRIWLKNSWISPYVINKHGVNLLHAAAKYAQADMCHFLLDIGVDGSAYDDNLLTPLDYLARSVCSSYPYPSRVVNTIRALVERGQCQPLLPLTSNTVAFYRGPEEGFAWLFASEYAGCNLEQYDSEGWTLLHDAAFNLAWWTRLCVEEPAASWQSIYLLRAGVDPHSKTSEGDMTPLDTFLRGSTANGIDHAKRWLEALSEAGIDLHEYALKEQCLHSPDHFLNSSWDEEHWEWIPTKRRVVYKYGPTSKDLEIWLEDYDALSWFHCGGYDLDIFQVRSRSDGTMSGPILESQDRLFSIDEERGYARKPGEVKWASFQRAIVYFLQSRWFQLLILSLLLNYWVHKYLS